ncbi:hypothetical protein JL722_10899 [Aureococcus anophagefferens]|nr:hypothetical protein JL722_10899 [Aureococcus anophagefferens]
MVFTGDAATAAAGGGGAAPGGGAAGGFGGGDGAPRPDDALLRGCRSRSYCTSLDGESTYAKCVNNCQTASANVQHVGECEYGCEYWALLPEEEPEETVTKTKASYVSKSSWNEVAFIAVLGCIIVLLLGYRRRRMRLRSGASQPDVPIKTVYNNGTEVL